MALTQKEADLQMLLAAGVHLGTKNVNYQVCGMQRYTAQPVNRGEVERGKGGEMLSSHASPSQPG